MNDHELVCGTLTPDSTDYVPVVILVVKILISCYAHSHNPGQLDLLVGEKKSRDKGHAGTLK